MSDDYLPYAPNLRYVTKNLKPEYIKKSTVRDLALALKDTNDAGILNPKVDKWMLPQTLVEGRDDYGLSMFGDLAEKDPKIKQFLNDKIKNYQQQNDPPHLYYRDVERANPNLPPDYFLRQRYQMMVDSNREGLSEAPFNPIALLQQLMTKYKGNEQLALERWNGKGVAKVPNGNPLGGTVQADSHNHLRKVNEAYQMLQHPANKELLNYFNAFRNPTHE
jgi:hypothetical protein